MERHRHGHKAWWRGCATAACLLATSPAYAQFVPDLRGGVAQNVPGLPGASASMDTGGAAGAVSPAPDLSDQLSGPVPDGDDVAGADLIGDLITGSIDPPAEDADPIGRVTRVAPVEGGGGVADPAPYAPLGLRLGTFDVTATLDLGMTYLRTDSTFKAPGPPASLGSARTDGAFGEAVLSVDAVSDWARHGLELGFDGRLPFRVSGSGDREPSFSTDAALRLNVDRNTQLTASGSYDHRRADPGSAAVAEALDPVRFRGVGTASEPVVRTVSGALTVQRRVGRLAATAEVNALRQTVGEALLSTGATVSQDDLNFMRYGVRLRGGYSASPVLAPFVEVEASHRRMDQRPDSRGSDRNAMRYALRLGAAFDRGEKLSGEVAVGYVHEDIADASLADIGGLSVRADVTWSPRRETDVDFGFVTATTNSSQAATSGALVHVATLGLTHRARANLTFDGRASLRYEDVVGPGEDTVTAAGLLGATWWFNRFMGLTGRIGHERTFSDDPTQQTRTSSAFMGIRLQR